MNAIAAKAEIIQWITELNDKSTILELRKLKEKLSLKAAISSELSTFQIDSIKRGFEDSKNGRVIPHSEVKKKYEKWL
jgi:predicted transcriptional regulator